MARNNRPLIPLALLIALQVLDVAVHVAAQQVEPMRITSNIIMVAGAITGTSVAGSSSRLVIPVAGAAYLFLNLLFLLQHGLVNPATDALRVPLFAFVIASLALLYWVARRRAG